MNHFSQEFQQTLWWTPQPPLMEPNQSPLNSQFHRPPTTPFYTFNLNHHQDDDDPHHHLSDDPQLQVPTPPTNKEAMFEKPLTPSDVGKLNRLVIPKQHAERYFPLGGNHNNSSADPGEKGLLLNFEDEDGKCWRFRYSYWNSSQSYVLTKGWSRFVKDKRLDAGDVVLFERSRLESDRLFIGWRRRNNNGDGGSPAASQPSPANNNNSSNGVGGGWTRMFYSAPSSYPSHPSNGPPPVCSMPYPQPQQQLPPSSAPASCLHAATGRAASGNTNGNSKTLRLFGVNLECYQPDDESEPSTPDGSTISSQGGQGQYHHYTTTSQTHHMDMDYSGDVTQLQQMRRSYHQG